MINKVQINERWLKAAVLGTTWAASEIVFGSFLHNLRIPFSGNMLTAIGLIILISASYKWPENGIFWRAGIVCALMKTVSPSAVIFGPIIAIFTEAMLLELAVFVFGKNIFGYLIGAVLAMSWVLFQRIINLIIFYGANIIDIYSGLMKMAEKQFSIETDLVWLPIFLLLALHILFGIFAGFLGIKAGKRLISNNKDYIPPADNNFTMSSKTKDLNFPYSIFWLWLNVGFIIASLLILSFASFYVWSVVIIAILIVWTSRYKSAIRHLSKPKFWLFFMLITMFAAIVSTALQTDSGSLFEGILTGVQMNFRAAIVIVGFSILGKELYNPKIINFFQQSSYRQLHLAMELSFQSVPLVISQLPSAKNFFKNPVSAISYLIDSVDLQIHNLSNSSPSKAPVFIVSGKVAEGKTTFIKELVSHLASNQLQMAGIYSQRMMNEGETIGYDVVNVRSGISFPFLRIGERAESQKIGKFHILNDGYLKGLEILEAEMVNHIDLIVMDEIGKLELKQAGWSMPFTQWQSLEVPLLIAVRSDFVEEIISHWNITNYMVFEVSETKVDTVLPFINEAIKTLPTKPFS